jgi:hypothetical protein
VATGVRAKGHRCAQGWPPALYPCGVMTEEAKRRALIKHSKSAQ